ncbi:MAG: glucose-1-phosphate adenylyltransferase subunit GlgD [Oscillospiraceae bacterium]|nr:glucose-1-phosphate adenylyltransferase subunit GlgD [Oscillospiraceae bacterium]
MNVMGIIFANDGSLGSLTAQRTMASLPFGGRYRQVDFALSNLAAIGVRHVGIVTRHHYQSLVNHIGSGEEWGMELEEGGLEFLTPYAMSKTDTYRGKLESLHAAMGFLEYGAEDEHLVMIDSSVLSNIDLSDVIAKHIASGKDVTVVTKAGVCNGKQQFDLAMKLDKNGNISDMAVDYAAPADYVASMDIYVVSKKWLAQQVKEHIAHNLYHMDRDLVLGQWQKGAITVNPYVFPGEVLFTESVDDYFANNLSLLDKKMRHDLFGYNHPVYTKVRDRVPTYYGESCVVENCLVADGCMLDGNVKNSILFRQVSICAGAEVENCVIMNDTVVGENSELKYVILDKDVTVRPGARLIGTPHNPIVVKRGDTV